MFYFMSKSPDRIDAGAALSPEEPSMFHVFCIFVVLFLGSDSNPEEVLWLLPLVNYLQNVFISFINKILSKKKVL